jgi:peptidoglycan/xylan/chitin deacetylase (PgdA/CDA1 family)
MKIFFRNDDVRGSLDDSLIQLTELFVKYSVPITHAVEPANVSNNVVKWLIDTKLNSNDLVEIIQHGYNHNNNNKFYKMEFGGNRSYSDQYEDIHKGYSLMESLFNYHWDKIFSFPYGTYNNQTMEVVNQLKYTAISSSVSYDIKNIIKDYIGVKLNTNKLFNRNISYHLNKRPFTELWDVSTCISVIKEYINEDEAIHFTYEQLISKINHARRFTSVIGILLHHRFHKDYLSIIDKLLNYLKNNDYSFTKITKVINDIS